MKSIIIRLSLAFSILALLSLTARADTMYGGIAFGAGSNRGNLVTVDQTTGAGTFVGSGANPLGLTGLTFDPSGTLFGSTIGGSSTTSTLVIIDPSTGAVIATIGAITVGGVPIKIGDLACDPLNGLLYGIRSNPGGGGLLYTIDKLTGVATFVGDTGAGAGGGIAFTSDGKLYQTAFNASDFTSLNQLDPTDASRISTVAIDDYFDGLGIRPDGVFFASTGDGQGVYTIDPITGVETFLGDIGDVGHASDFAFRISSVSAVPDQGSLLMFPGTVGLLIAGHRLYRKAHA